MRREPVVTNFKFRVTQDRASRATELLLCLSSHGLRRPYIPSEAIYEPGQR